MKQINHRGVRDNTSVHSDILS